MSEPVPMRLLAAFARLWGAIPLRSQAILALVPLCAILSWCGRDRAIDVPGLPAPARPVTVALMAPEAFNARAAQAAQAAFTAVAQCRRLAMHELRLVRTVEPRAPIAPTGLVDLATRRTTSPAFFVPGTDSIFTLSTADATVYHEWVHAVDDQAGPRMRRAAAGATTDEQVALRGVIEGTAQMAVSNPPASFPMTDDIDQNAWSVAYSLGQDFVRQRSGGSLRAALALAPATAYEVMFGYAPAHRADPAPTPPQAGEQLLCADRLGAAAVVATMLRAGRSGRDAMLVSQAWAGDRLERFAGPAGQRLVWSVAFADTAAAAQWRAGPALEVPLTAPRTVLLTLSVSGTLPPKSALDALGK